MPAIQRTYYEEENCCWFEFIIKSICLVVCESGVPSAHGKDSCFYSATEKCLILPRIPLCPSNVVCVSWLVLWQVGLEKLPALWCSVTVYSLRASKSPHECGSGLHEIASFPMALPQSRHLGARDAGCSSRLIGSTFYSTCWEKAWALGSSEWGNGASG